jgi:hypothetical protein
MVGIAGTFTVAQLAGSAFAGPTPDALSQGKKLLAVYRQTNQQLADCMAEKKLPFDGQLVKSDVVDAFGGPRALDKLGALARAEVDALVKAAADDPNAGPVSEMPPDDQVSWADAVNECSERIALEQSGGVDRQAEIDELQRAAEASPEVQTAAAAYVTCMGGYGFAVVKDPFRAPQSIMDAVESGSAADKDALDRYDGAWRTCVEPYQEVYDRAVFG